MNAMLTPTQRYQADLDKPGFQADPAQARAVAALQRVHDELKQNRLARRGLFRRRVHWAPVQGLYLCGGVGRGKTWLMDAFYESLDFAEKRRTHFHRFMLEVHERRKAFPDHQDPLREVALQYAREVRVLCFDEFYVSDIADAMILGRLIEVLFGEGVTLVATSNCAPDALYPDGLQRQNFLPAIATLKQHVEVLNVDSGIDYRLRQLTHLPLYLCPSDATAREQLNSEFQALASGNAGIADAQLEVNGRPLTAIRSADDVVWFSFAELCIAPRGVADYIELARCHHSVIVSDIPRLDADLEDAARRFINLVDEFYDRGVKLILAAAVPQNELYVGKRLSFEFRRTYSRLTEMQSEEYLARPHLA